MVKIIVEAKDRSAAKRVRDHIEQSGIKAEAIEVVKTND